MILESLIVWALRRPYFLKMNDDKLERIIVSIGYSMILISLTGMYLILK